MSDEHEHEHEHEHDPDPDPRPDPRPVFEGDWNSATGVEKGQHSQRVREWTARQGAKAQSRMATGLDREASTAQPLHPPPDAATRAVLVAIRDSASAHDSDRIRAAQALIAMDREREQQQVGPSPLTALRQVLDTLQPHERLAWLQGERLGAMGDAQSG